MLKGICFAFLLAALAAPAWAHGDDERCGVVVPREGGNEEVVQVPGFVVTDLLGFQLPAGYEDATAVICGRTELRIEDNDYLVLLQGGIPLFIISDDRTLILQMKDGQVYAELEGVELTEMEETQIQDALNRAQELNQSSTN